MLLIPRTLGNSNMINSMIFWFISYPVWPVHSFWSQLATCNIFFTGLSVFSWCFLLHWLFHLYLLLCWILLISVTFQFLCDPGFSPWISSLTILSSLVILGCLIIFSTISMLVTPRFMFPVQMSFWMSDIQWPMNHIHRKLKISNWIPTFPPNLIFFAFFYISKNRIVFPIFEAQNFRIILFLFLWLTLHIHLTSDPVDSTLEYVPKPTTFCIIISVHARLFWCELLPVASDLFPYFPCVLLLSIST